MTHDVTATLCVFLNHRADTRRIGGAVQFLGLGVDDSPF